MSKEIPLTKGYVAIVDDEDFEFLSKWKWHEDQGYAKRSSRIEGSWPTKYKIIPMHRVIMKTPDDMDVDHIDHNKTNNQKINLRNVTRSQNNMNRFSQNGSTSSYKGVCWDSNRKRWMAKIGLSGKTKYLGRFEKEEDAALAYNFAALEYFGEYSMVNTVNS